jgi:hypothetical protein
MNLGLLSATFFLAWSNSLLITIYGTNKTKRD